MADTINRRRKWQWYAAFTETGERGSISTDRPCHCGHNAHRVLYHPRRTWNEKPSAPRTEREWRNAVFHYVPLHSSPAGQRVGLVHGTMRTPMASVKLYGCRCGSGCARPTGRVAGIVERSSSDVQLLVLLAGSWCRLLRHDVVRRRPSQSPRDFALGYGGLGNGRVDSH
jgi:hypothetical protein